MKAASLLLKGLVATHLLRTIMALALAMSCATLSRAAVRVEKTEYKGWKNCYRITNGEIEAIVTSDVGPRIIRFAFLSGQNLFKEFSDQLGKGGEEKFQLRGGHRVWKAPEDPVATWTPDNVPVEIQITRTGIVAREPVEPLTKLQKEIEVRMAESGTRMTVINRITNRGLFPLQFSAWALTMMAPGGVAVSGFPPRGKHPMNLEATNPLVMWAYTNLGDPRWKFTKKYLTLRQDPRQRRCAKARHVQPGYMGNISSERRGFSEAYESGSSKKIP